MYHNISETDIYTWLKCLENFTPDSLEYARMFYQCNAATVVHFEEWHDFMVDKYPSELMQQLYDEIGMPEYIP